MPTNTINISRSVRMRYFNGLFLQDQEFKTDQNFYIAIRRYLNFLLFDPGRLYVDDTIAPLQVSAAGMQVSVTHGSALIRDTAAMSGYELEIPNLPVTDREFDLSTESLSDGDTLTVTLQRDESDFISMGGGGAGVSPSEDDRTVERALLSVNLPGDPAPTPPFVPLATITAVASGGGGVADTLNVTNTNERGGVRLAILSKDVRDMLGGPDPGTATLTGISISPGGPLTITEGSTQALVANGDFDDGTSHALTAGEGLNWTSSAPAVASVHPTNGTVTAVSSGPVTITASAQGQSDTVSITVTPAVIPVNVISFTPGTTIPGAANLEIRGTGIHRAGLSVGGPATGTTVRFLDAGTSTVRVSTTSVIVLSPLGDDTQRIRVTVPSTGSFTPVVPPGTTLPTNIQVRVDGDSDTLTSSVLNIIFT